MRDVRLLCACPGEWDPRGYVMRSRDEQPVRVSGSASLDEGGSCASAITGVCACTTRLPAWSLVEAHGSQLVTGHSTQDTCG